MMPSHSPYASYQSSLSSSSSSSISSPYSTDSGQSTTSNNNHNNSGNGTNSNNNNSNESTDSYAYLLSVKQQQQQRKSSSTLLTSGHRSVVVCLKIAAPYCARPFQFVTPDIKRLEVRIQWEGSTSLQFVLICDSYVGRSEAHEHRIARGRHCDVDSCVSSNSGTETRIDHVRLSCC